MFFPRDAERRFRPRCGPRLAFYNALGKIIFFANAPARRKPGASGQVLAAFFSLIFSKWKCIFCIDILLTFLHRWEEV